MGLEVWASRLVTPGFLTFFSQFLPTEVEWEQSVQRPGNDRPPTLAIEPTRLLPVAVGCNSNVAITIRIGPSQGTAGGF